MKQRIGGKVSYTPKSGKQPKSPYTSAQENALIQIENKTYTLKREQAHLVDQNGVILFKKGGGKSSVSFTRGEFNQMKGQVLTHNHPLDAHRSIGGTFSPEDINLAFSGKLKGLRATAVEGTYDITYVNDSNTKYKAGALESHYRKESKRLERIARQAMQTAKINYYRSNMTQADYNAYHATAKSEMDKVLNGLHTWLTNNASDYGYQYTFTART